eukprot:10504310-Lingulodinium_polyedra.AAC.1
MGGASTSLLPARLCGARRSTALLATVRRPLKRSSWAPTYAMRSSMPGAVLWTPPAATAGALTRSGTGCGRAPTRRPSRRGCGRRGS